MSDTYPQNFDIEIDRNGLRKYLRVQWFLAWMLVAGVLAFASTMAALDSTSQKNIFSRLQVTASVITIGLIIIALFAVGTLGYFVFSHRRAVRHAHAVELSVEGSFLRLRRNLWLSSDRKLHFRSIVDYSTTQGPLMRRFGIHALQMSTPAGGTAATFQVVGVKDCLKVRDMLAEIDRLRENQ